MQVEKKVLANLTKCYSIAPLTYQGRFIFWWRQRRQTAVSVR